MAQQLQISGTFTTAQGSDIVNANIVMATPLGLTTGVALASGFNTITVPTGATCVIITFPVGNATAVTLKGLTGDTGIPLNPTGTNVLQLISGATTLNITAGGAIAALTYIKFE